MITLSTPEFIRLRRRDLPKHPMSRTPLLRIDECARAAADAANVSIEDIFSPSRKSEFTWPRFMAYWLARVVTKHGAVTIGRRFGDRDHSTILGGIRRHEARMRYDDDWAALAKKLLSELEAA